MIGAVDSSSCARCMSLAFRDEKNVDMEREEKKYVLYRVKGIF